MVIFIGFFTVDNFHQKLVETVTVEIADLEGESENDTDSKKRDKENGEDKYASKFQLINFSQVQNSEYDALLIHINRESIHEVISPPPEA